MTFGQEFGQMGEGTGQTKQMASHRHHESNGDTSSSGREDGLRWDAQGGQDQGILAQVDFVIRLNTGTHPSVFTNAEGRRVRLTIALEETAVYHQIYYGGRVRVSVIDT